MKGGSYIPFSYWTEAQRPSNPASGTITLGIEEGERTQMGLGKIRFLIVVHIYWPHP